ncbi:MAG: lipoyl synthase [bacterium]
MTTTGGGNVRRLPDWFKVRLPGGDRFAVLKENLERGNLHTICEEARCPNRGDCWSAGAATFLLLGPTCTRACRYCHVGAGEPAAPDPSEPESVAEAASALGLKYVVITSVTRDDLPDGGAAHFAQTVERVKARLPESRVEVLAPDFGGDVKAIASVVAAKPYVFGHNIETVEALFPALRPQGDFSRSIEVLRKVKEIDPEMKTKSGLMLGLGEMDAQIRETLSALRGAGVGRLTLGQYLQPSRELAAVARFVTPDEFDAWAAEARGMGFKWVMAGPNVRSSYHAGSGENE